MKVQLRNYAEIFLQAVCLVLLFPGPFLRIDGWNVRIYESFYGLIKFTSREPTKTIFRFCVYAMIYCASRDSFCLLSKPFQKGKCATVFMQYFRLFLKQLCLEYLDLLSMHVLSTTHLRGIIITLLPKNTIIIS